MQTKVQKWGNGSGIRLSKEFLQSAGVALGDSLNATVSNGQIILTPQLRHRSLKERAAIYGGKLNLSEEMPREEPTGNVVW